jgi:class 3 adenylate cyclase/Tfp pilus assembly protein PilF
MNHKVLLLIVVVLILPILGFSQNDRVDSLKAIIPTLKEDSNKVNALNELSLLLWDTQPDITIMYAMEAIELGYRINFKKGVAYALKNIGMGYYTKGDYIEVLQNFQQSLATFDSIGDKIGVSNLLNNLGSVYMTQGDDAKAIENNLKALRVAEEIGDTMRILSANINIGIVYLNKEETLDKSLEYLLKGLELAEELEYQDAIGNASVNIGELYYIKNNYDSALVYFEKSLKASEAEGGGFEIYSLNNLGKVYLQTGKYESAISYHERAYEMAQEIDDNLQIAQSLVGLGNVYRTSGDYNQALIPYREAQTIAEQIGAIFELELIYEGLAITYSELKNYTNAFKYQTLLTGVNLEIYNAENDKKVERLQFAFDLEKKQGEIDLLTTEKALQDAEMKRQKTANRAFLVGIVLVLIIIGILLYSYREKVKTFKILDRQKVEIENLILNILPKEIARELQAEGEATPRYYENVSVLFTDFKGFSSISQGMTPNELVEQLNAYFHAFDDIMGRFGLEKIKTIGDAYMCAGGIPLPNKTHPIDIVKAGLAMQEYINQRKEELSEKGEVGWDLRVGIHTGPIVAGVVGKKKYAYDIWGNTVNIASRMESNGEPGRVNISAATYNLVKDHYKCHHRGKISAKNVGEIDMYFIEEEIPEQSEIETVKT